MRTYTVQQLARMAGVSVRTLHHYDQIGLLKPGARTDSGYRIYGEKELIRLQQILFYKELELPLQEVKRILDNPRFDPSQALKGHRKLLQKRIERYYCLIGTIDATLNRLEGEAEMLTDKELYKGFSKEKMGRYKREAREMFGEEIVERTEQKIKKFSSEKWNEVKAEGDSIARLLSELMDRGAGDSEVQKVIERHHAWIENFYEAPADLYRGLGQLYATHKDFRATYDNYRIGLADFFKSAIDYYCDHALKSDGD